MSEIMYACACACVCVCERVCACEYVCVSASASVCVSIRWPWHPTKVLMCVWRIGFLQQTVK